MKTVFAVFPNQLFKQILNFNKQIRIIIVQDSLFFSDTERSSNLSKVKIAYTRATCALFAKELEANGFKPELLEYSTSLKDFLQKNQIGKVQAFQVVDHLLEQRLNKTTDELNIELEFLRTPAFLYSDEELEEYFKSQKAPYFHNNFYKYFRVKRNWLMTKNGFVGGKLSFDQENRKRMPDSVNPPSAFVELSQSEKNEWKSACEWTLEHFPNNPGKFECLFPIGRETAELQFEKFLNERFEMFGPYQDALRKPKSMKDTTLFHSTIAAALNSGLLDPLEIVEKLLKAKAPIQSMEGLLRQIIGWREFTRMLYVREGTSMRLSRLLEYPEECHLTEKWYQGTTGIPPIDDAIKVAFSVGYLHHIQRLMLLGNFMTILGIDPDEMYKWFLEFSLDAYDWVMIPNVYGMASFASDLMSTKPYISGSNYVLKMSDYKKGDWTHIWDSLYYDFLDRNEEMLSGNYRMSMMYANWRKKTDQQKADLLSTAEKFRQSIYSIKKPKH